MRKLANEEISKLGNEENEENEKNEKNVVLGDFCCELCKVRE